MSTERSAENGVQHHVAHFEDYDALYAYLARLNEDGHHPEMGCIDTHGIAFLATLTDPDADRVHYILADHDGRAHVPDEWCNEFCQCSWKAAYPVVALSQQSPATVWREIAKAQREQDERDEARFAKARAERSTSPATEEVRDA